MIDNELNMKLFSNKSYGFEILSLSAMSLGFISQTGRANNSKIISRNWSYTDWSMKIFYLNGLIQMIFII